MSKFRVFRVSAMWSTSRWLKEVEENLEEIERNGYEIVSVSFGYSIWRNQTAFITAKKVV